jgi:uncharacterized protein YjiK
MSDLFDMTSKTVCTLCILFLIVLICFAGYVYFSKQGLDRRFPQQITTFDQAYFHEPSGLTFHPQRETLFVVGDEGDIGEILLDGVPIRQKRLLNADFEGVTTDPATGLLYIAVEGEEKILEVDPGDFTILREFYIDRFFQGAMLLKPGGQGIEAITFVSNPEHPEGGTFYLTNQNFDAESLEDPSIIFEVEVSLNSGSPGDAKIVQYFSIGIGDLSGLYYNQMSDSLYVISDMTDTLFEITKTGNIVNSFPLPGADQEGIALDRAGQIYISQDSGGIIKLTWNSQ